MLYRLKVSQRWNGLHRLVDLSGLVLEMNLYRILQYDYDYNAVVDIQPRSFLCVDFEWPWTIFYWWQSRLLFHSMYNNLFGPCEF